MEVNKTIDNPYSKKKKKKLRPVIFEFGKYNYHKNNFFKQNLLLKAMQTTSDVKEMKRLTGIKSVAEVYRTLDKIAIRKEYHEALARNGIDLDTIINGIKDLCVNSNSDRVKLSGYQTFLKSLGLDEYKEDNGESGKNWEEKMKKLVQGEMNETDNKDNIKETKVYEVIQPKVPEAEKKRLAEEEEDEKYGKNLYEQSR